MTTHITRCALALALATGAIASHTDPAAARASCVVSDTSIRVVFSDAKWARRYIVDASVPKAFDPRPDANVRRRDRC